MALGLPAARRTVPLELPPVTEPLEWEGDPEAQHADKGWQAVYARVGLAKADVAADYIEMLANCLEKDKLLVFFHHEVVGNILEAKLKQAKIEHVRIDGKTPATKRGLEAARFQEDPSIRIAVLSITACGVGLTLTAASVVVFAELYSVPKIMEQAEDRAHRIGQTKSVDIHYLVARGTVDDSILACMARKTADLQHLLPLNEGLEVEEIKMKPLMDRKIMPAVRASARPLAQISAASRRPEPNERMPERTLASPARILTVRSRGLCSTSSIAPQQVQKDKKVNKRGNSKPAILLDEDHTSAGVVPKQPVVLDDSEDEVYAIEEGPAPTLNDSDSDVEIAFG